jgi:4'-phosphopantetheinyl transferase
MSETTLIHLWTAEPGPVGGPGWDAALGLLDAEERRRAERFYFDRDRRTFVAAHALLRRLISSLLPAAPEAWSFALGSHGKPRIAGPVASTDLEVNLSHTEGLVVAAAARGLVLGVDVERHTRTVDLALAGRYFASAEVRAFEMLPAEARRERFFRLWTLKEAYIKAVGLGLTLPLDSFAFTLDPIGITIDGQPRGTDADWRFWQWQPTGEHWLALAARVTPAVRASRLHRHLPSGITPPRGERGD